MKVNVINKKWYFLIFLTLACFSCVKQNVEPLHFFGLMELPEGFPPIYLPEDNEFTQARWELGKRLFFDTTLSRDSSVSCASCHFPALAFSDSVAFSLGVDKTVGTRNAPSLANVAYHPYFTREGGVPTLEMQVLVPVQEHNEFDFNIILIAERLKQDSTYTQQSYAAYQRQPDPFVITRALACFERTLISGYSPYDQFITYHKNTLSKSERQGMDLFFSDKTNCSTCHSDFNFTNYALENNGLYKVYSDEGKFRLTGDSSDIALFKVPSLRNVGITAPYMHDGSFKTLTEVVEHYNSGGKNHPHKSDLIRPLSLTQQERKQLIEFLETLTDDSFINNPLFRE